VSALEDALLLRAATGFMFYGDEGNAFYVLPDESGEGEWIIVRTVTEHHPYVAHQKIDMDFRVLPAVLSELESTPDRTLRWAPWHPIHDVPDDHYCIRFSTLREACLRAMECSEGKHEDYVDDASSWKEPWWSRPQPAVDGMFTSSGFEVDQIAIAAGRVAADLVIKSTPRGTSRIFESGEYHAHLIDVAGAPASECRFGAMKEGDRFVLDYEARGGGIGNVLEVFRIGSEGKGRDYVDAFRVEDSEPEGQSLSYANAVRTGSLETTEDPEEVREIARAVGIPLIEKLDDEEDEEGLTALDRSLDRILEDDGD